MMSKTERHLSADADWRQLEEFVEQLDELARAPIETQEFYQRLLDGCVTLLAAEGGVIWLPAGRGRWQVGYQINGERIQSGAQVSGEESSHLALLNRIAGNNEPQILLPHSGGAHGSENTTAFVLALTAIREASAQNAEGSANAIVELFLRPGSSPEVQQGWHELFVTVAQVAADFHLHEQLRRLRVERGFYDQSLALMRRFQHSTDLRQTASEIANEGRGFVAADRLSVVVRQGKSWQLRAASGVDRIESRSDAAKRLQMLASATAAWGEPLEYGAAEADEVAELPPELADLIEQHVDESHARQLVVVPIEFDREVEDTARRGRVDAVLIAEQFSNEAGEFSRQRVLELAGLCEPALRQAQQLDRFPVRNTLRWADRWARLCEGWGLTKLAAASAVAVAVVAALVFVPSDFEMEAPATLTPLVERDVFATTNGKVVEVRIAHGQQVAAGEVLAVLHDPQLSLDVQRVQGEIETTRKRLEAIAIARTDRKVREDATNEKLPLSAEAKQLEKRLASLQIQQEILASRREALTLRSPIAGKLLTLDVQKMLMTRPVERGQVLFTVADTTAGWRLSAEMPQDRIGHVVAAQQKGGPQLPVRFRLAGDTEQTYAGHVESVSTAIVLDTAGLDQESPAVKVLVAVDDDLLEDGALTAARPGMSAQVRIYCGRRSLGYVWLHDIWDTLYSWVVF